MSLPRATSSYGSSASRPPAHHRSGDLPTMPCSADLHCTSQPTSRGPARKSSVLGVGHILSCPSSADAFNPPPPPDGGGRQDVRFSGALRDWGARGSAEPQRQWRSAKRVQRHPPVPSNVRMPWNGGGGSLDVHERSGGGPCRRTWCSCSPVNERGKGEQPRGRPIHTSL